MAIFQKETNMKKLLTIHLICALAAITLSGCSSTRKAVQSSKSEQITAQTTTAAGTTTENKEATDMRINLSEHLSAVIDFTRYEYSDGTVKDVVNPATSSDIIRPRNREQTEPPNPGKNLVAVTTGRINLNKGTERTEETQATNETKNQSSLTSQNNTTSNSTQDTKTTEKPKRGIIHQLGAITASVIAVIILGFLIRWLIRRKTPE